jgi:formate dehydrogenase maturation protein FdhE
MEGFLDEAANLSKNQFQEFVRQILEHLSKEKKNKKILRVFNNYESIEKQDLFDITAIFFWENWEAEALSDYDIRTAENAMNGITGREDRDYHSGINY